MSSPSGPQRTNVPPDQTTTFPLETLTEHQREVFTKYIDAKRETGKGLEKPIWLALVLVGEKPATKIADFHEYPNISISAKEIIEAFDLVYHQHFEHSFDVARTSWRFDLLPTTGKGVTESAFYRRLGCFYGYRKTDVEHFIETTGWDVHPTELAKKGEIQPKEAAYMVFLPHRYDAAEHYERAIESGKRIRDIIADCAARWNFSYLDEHAEWVYQKALEQYTP